MNRLCVHTITTKPWSLEKALHEYNARGISGVSVWQNAVQEVGLKKASTLLADSGLDVVSYVRGGFFPAANSADRQKAIEHNKQMLDEAAAIGAPLLVLVCGADPVSGLSKSRDQIRAGLEAILPHAEDLGVGLAIEPLHPMYADTRSAINTLSQANDMAEYFEHEKIGVAVDVYHLWWDDQLQDQIARCGEGGNLLAFHICDWKYPTEDMLNDRGLMGEGCIPIKEISDWVDAAGFEGYREVEIFSDKYWSMDQGEFLDLIVDSYNKIYK